MENEVSILNNQVYSWKVLIITDLDSFLKTAENSLLKKVKTVKIRRDKVVAGRKTEWKCKGCAYRFKQIHMQTEDTIRYEHTGEHTHEEEKFGVGTNSRK